MSMIRVCASMSALLLATACASAPPAQPTPPPVRLDELVALSKQQPDDDAMVAQLAQRGVAFVLSPQDAVSLREAGVSDGVVRYLQGRADGDAALAARIQRGRYPVSGYYGVAYLGYPYLGYAGGLHYYGEPGYRFLLHGGYHGGHGWHGGHGGHGRGHGRGHH
ncbi:hypothetical protein [uncultured Methylibium sp.]|uniref:hypothetical protein n=1 Tax=uncultured Methylibium sp. TaxID=381093 RepID=UPI0025DF0476|nr:hypothetical protein [uncultured Methylibium sp.]